MMSRLLDNSHVSFLYCSRQKHYAINIRYVVGTNINIAIVIFKINYINNVANIIFAISFTHDITIKIIIIVFF